MIARTSQHLRRTFAAVFGTSRASVKLHCISLRTFARLHPPIGGARVRANVVASVRACWTPPTRRGASGAAERPDAERAASRLFVAAQPNRRDTSPSWCAADGLDGLGEAAGNGQICPRNGVWVGLEPVFGREFSAAGSAGGLAPGVRVASPGPVPNGQERS